MSQPNQPLQPLTYGFPMQGRKQQIPNLHGSAAWLKRYEAENAGLFQRGGAVLGQARNGNLMSFHDDGHLLVFAPSGAGKGIGFVQPNLALYPGSMIVLDPKGENVAVSARHRRDNFNQRVVVLDPFGESNMPSDSYNPLAPLSFLPPSEIVGEVRGMAEALIPSRGGRDEAHWINGARMFIEALLLFMLVHEPLENRHLVRLHTLAFGSSIHLHNLFAALQKGHDPDPEMARLCVALGNWWQGREEKEKSYFISIAHQELAWLGNVVWQNVLTGNAATVDPKGEPTTVYLVLPWLRLRANRNWLRVMVASLITAVINTRGRPDTPVLFMLDEAFLGLARLEIISEAAAILRSEGGRIALVYQDMLQLKSLYPDEWESFLANAGASLFFAVNDMTGARYVSDRCGMETVPVSGSTTGQGRALRQASEIITMPKDEMICFLRGLSPARFGRMDVRTDSRFDLLLDPNPKYQSVIPRRAIEAQGARGHVPINLDAPIERSARHDQTEMHNPYGEILTETGEVWKGEEQPLPPPPSLTPNELERHKEGGILSAKHGQYVIWSEQQRAFGYLDFGAFVPVG